VWSGLGAGFGVGWGEWSVFMGVLCGVCIGWGEA
jgi:hypothetical protein